MGCLDNDEDDDKDNGEDQDDEDADGNKTHKTRTTCIRLAIGLAAFYVGLVRLVEFRKKNSSTFSFINVQVLRVVRKIQQVLSQVLHKSGESYANRIAS